MSVIEVKTLQDGLGGRLEGVDPAEVKRSFRVRYRAECSSLADDPMVVWEHFKNTSTLPYPGRTYAVGASTDVEAKCVELDVDRRNRSQFYFVVATFDPNSGSGEQDAAVSFDENGEPTKDPTKFRDEIEVSWSPITEGVQKAIFRGFDPAVDGGTFLEPGTESVIVNTARQAIEGVEREDHIKIIRISKYRGGYDSALFSQFELETVNTDIVTIWKQAYKFRETFGAYRGKLVPVPATLGFLNNILYYRHTLEVHVHPRTWRKHLANIGTAEAFFDGDELDGVALFSQNGDFGDEEGADFLTRAITDDDGLPITAPVLLDARGKRIKSKTHPTIFLIWSIYPEAPFAGIEW